jgi:fatty acid desaturase
MCIAQVKHFTRGNLVISSYVREGKMTSDARSLPVKGDDFAELKRQIKAAGLLRRRPVYYTMKISITMLLFASGWVVLFWVGASWWCLMIAMFLAVMNAQVSFIGHDSGHGQIFSQKASIRLNLVLGNLLSGLSTGWWNDKHNRHHAHPNQDGKDPDVDVGVIAWTPDQVASRGSIGLRIARVQAYLFLPLLFLEGLNLQFGSFKAMRGDTIKSKRMRRLELVLLVLHAALYSVAVFAALTAPQAVAFIAIHQGLWGFYMGIAFAPNHKGMLMLSAEEELDWLRSQVLTSRNIRGGRFINLFLGGLNYQIEHHLFPRMPSPNLRRAQDIVRKYCQRLDVSYADVGFVKSYVEAMKFLHDVGNSVRR